MLTENLGKLELLQAWFDSHPSSYIHFNFPIHSGTGAKSTSVVYMELDPGFQLRTHTDSAEEIVLVLEGTLQGIVGDEQGELSFGELVVIPAMVPHSFRNTGNTKARAIGFFSSATVVSTFDHPAQPMNRRLLGTPVPVEEPQATPA